MLERERESERKGESEKERNLDSWVTFILIYFSSTKTLRALRPLFAPSSERKRNVLCKNDSKHISMKYEQLFYEVRGEKMGKWPFVRERLFQLRMI